MQNRPEPKPKTTQYSSLKEYLAQNQNTKKHTKSTHPKSHLKNKTSKNHNQSQSKLKNQPKNNKNNENFNSVNIANDNPTKIKSGHH